MEANLVNVSGLVFDIIGATLIALSIALANSKIIRAQSFTVTDANPVLEYALILQREDARFGLGKQGRDTISFAREAFPARLPVTFYVL